ncbi:sporulation integral membrane protein YlbJ [Alkalihalobacillus trypoxylicola]|uniref:Sporulation integral membrane protein YlbJ n=1 Tax=Alkalihalobacillus trypoxylicola TaxID=519424 RepID=A0A162FB45_9BACI|nr:sporulation integral membrane protein YlbJ [Alkalihalobacillus trypoxylicola]KYG35194.1 sporulation integral membrane protein YlbJ [Alkalihalobacillus trypoxylicola]
MNSKRAHTLILASTALCLAVALMLFPKESLEASVRGMNIWWNVVFPSLLPFFIVSELLISFGVVTLLGSLLEPFMRPLFRVPGIGGFVWAMGLASGNPAGAKLSARLRKENKITKIEAERLVSFTSSSNPLFIFGAVAVGFFHNPALGILLALAHYGANLMVGLMMRFYGVRDHSASEFKNEDTIVRGTPLKNMVTILHKEHQKDGRPLGKILGDAVQSSVRTLLMIGGFIILFSVINKVLSLLEVINLLSIFVSFLLSFISLPTELSQPIISGLFEMTIGAGQISETTEASLLHQVIAVSFLLGFSGLSIQAQVASILAETDIRFKPFIIGRILQGILASVLSLLLFKPIYLERRHVTLYEQVVPTFQVHSFSENIWTIFLTYSPLITLIFLMLSIFIWTKERLYPHKTA